MNDDLNNIYAQLVYEQMKVARESGRVEKLYLYSVGEAQGIEIEGPAALFFFNLRGQETVAEAIKNFLAKENLEKKIAPQDIVDFIMRLKDKGYIQFSSHPIS